MTLSASLPEAAQQAGFLSPPLHAALRLVHIGFGGLSIAAGFVAVFAPKGRPVHRGFGAVFMICMLVMSGVASLLALNNHQAGNITAGLFTFYLVSSAWLAVKRAPGTVGRFEVGGMFVIAAVGAYAIWTGWSHRADPHGVDGVSHVVSYVFGGVCLWAGLMDLVTLRRGGLYAADRISRHLWRLCLALFIASGSFFLGQMKFIPAALRGPHIWVIALLPLGLLIFWLIRVRFRPWNGKAARGEPARAAA